MVSAATILDNDRVLNLDLSSSCREGYSADCGELEGNYGSGGSAECCRRPAVIGVPISQALKFAMACSAAQLISLTCLLDFSCQSRNLIEYILTGLLPRSGRSEATSHSPAYGGTVRICPYYPDRPLCRQCMAGDVEASCGLGGYRPSENRSLAAVTVQVSWCPMGARRQLAPTRRRS